MEDLWHFIDYLLQVRQSRREKESSYYKKDFNAYTNNKGIEQTYIKSEN